MIANTETRYADFCKRLKAFDKHFHEELQHEVDAANIYHVNEQDKRTRELTRNGK